MADTVCQKRPENVRNAVHGIPSTEPDWLFSATPPHLSEGNKCGGCDRQLARTFKVRRSRQIVSMSG